MTVTDKPLLRVCMTCRPGLKRMAGYTLSHGFCRHHFLETCAQNGMLLPWEKVELWVRRLFR